MYKYLYIPVVLFLSAFMLQGCSSEEDTGNPGFVQLESVSGVSERDYNRNFDEPRVDIHKEPTMVESDRVLKLNSADKKTSGAIVFSESGGVGYVYEKGVKKEVVVTSDVQGDLWAIDADGNSYPISGN